MSTIGIEKGRTAIYVDRMSSRKQPALFVARAYDTEYEGEPAVKVKIDRVAFIKTDEQAAVLFDALERMFAEDGGVRLVGNTRDITFGINMED